MKKQLNKVIILEGPDGSGKSTLAATLQKDHGFSVVRSYGSTGYFPDYNPQQLFRSLIETIIATCYEMTPVVIDRSFMSEWCYGKVMRDCDRLGTEGFRLMMCLAKIYDVKHVICLPPWETVKANWKVKREKAWDPAKGEGDYVDAVHKLSQIYQNYELINELDPITYQRFNYLSTPIERVLNA